MDDCLIGKMTNSLQELLAELLTEGSERTIARTSEAYHRLAHPFERRVVIFGTGQLGRFVLPALLRAGLDPLAFCDNNSSRWGTAINGVEVMPPAAALEKYGENACFLVAAYNSSPLRRQLQELGCRRIVPYPVFFWKHWANLPEEERLELPHRILQQADQIPSAYEMLADDPSREEFRAQIRWRCLMDYDCLPPHDPATDMYFPPDLMRLSANEFLVDCGAFDGDSIKPFVDRVDGRFRRICAFEPDPANLRALAQCIAAFPAEVAAKITVLPYALGRENGTVRFSAEGAVHSKLAADSGGVEVECRSLDAVLDDGECPTIIKMDIEGAETEAIPGAAKTIARCRPILAICAYHRCDHLWRIPKLLKEAYPDCKIFLRRYAEECWETVYYAMPPERLDVDRNDAPET
jgi:FkbM family methyltransferase